MCDQPVLGRAGGRSGARESRFRADGRRRGAGCWVYLGAERLSVEESVLRLLGGERSWGGLSRALFKCQVAHIRTPCSPFLVWVFLRFRVCPKSGVS